LRSPTILACWVANFGACRGLSQALSWQGAFLIKGLGLAQGSIGLLDAGRHVRRRRLCRRLVIAAPAGTSAFASLQFSLAR